MDSRCNFRITLPLMPAVVFRIILLVMAEYHIFVGTFWATITAKMTASMTMRRRNPSGRAVMRSMTSPVTSGMIQSGDALTI